MKKDIKFIEEEHKVFPGYGHHEVVDQFFKYPMILEKYWYTLTGAEQKVLTFILRKTYGWQKQSDKISLSQFTDGDSTGFGTGLSRSHVKRVIESLEERNFIKVTRYDHQPSLFELPLNEEGIAIVKEKKDKLDNFNARAHQAAASYLFVKDVNEYKETEI